MSGLLMGSDERPTYPDNGDDGSEPTCRHDARWIADYTDWVLRAYAERLVAAVREMPSGCHDHEGLRCNSDWFDGNCSLIDGAAVIDLIEGSKP